MNKTVKVVNLFTTLFYGAALLLVYAYLPISVDLSIQGMGSLHKQDFFYQALVLFIAINLLLRVVIVFGLKQLDVITHTWISSIISIINIYLTLLIAYIGIMNNSTSVSPEGYAYLNTIGPALMVLWLLGLIFLVIRKIVIKS